jgi:hypothetical protein
MTDAGIDAGKDAGIYVTFDIFSIPLVHSRFEPKR